MPQATFPNFLLIEDDRNFEGTSVFERFLRRAFEGPIQIICAHHITVHQPGKPPLEIPSADTLCFSPLLMSAVFGKERALQIMEILSQRAPEIRERVLADHLDLLDRQEAKQKQEVEKV